MGTVTKNYLDLTGLSEYDNLIKQYADDNDIKAIKTVLWDNINEQIKFYRKENATLSDTPDYSITISSSGGGGHDYDVSMNANKDEMTLSEDNVAKTTLPLVAEYIGTRANWNLLSPTEQAKYRRVTFLGEGGSNNYQLSHIGMIIQSTTLNSELLVQEIYGSDTHWIQHTGYFLRGATSGVVANQLQEDGGADTHTLTIAEMPSHSHTTGISGSQAGALNSGSSCANVLFDQSTGKNTTSTGGGQPHNNVPKYKNVYIWERVS